MSALSDLGLLFILEARDQASETFERLDATLDKFSESAEKAAETTKAAGDSINESLTSTASGADALDLAAARTEAAEERLATAIKAQADAEQALLDARAAAASDDELAQAADELAAAETRAAEAAGTLKDAQAAVADAAAVGDTDALATANDRLAAAEARAAEAAAALKDAQEEQAALTTSEDVANAADALTTAERTATAASDDLTAAQARQADVQKAVAASDGEAAEAARAQAAAQKQAAEDAEAAQGVLSKATKTAGLVTLGMAAVGYESVKAAGNFQDATEHLVTDAGESAKNLQMVRAGILAVSTETGTAASSITDAMYHIESGGMHGAEGLAVLKTAAEGARVGGADLDTVSRVLVGTLNAYGETSTNAATETKYSNSMMNELIATVGDGDMRMQDLASSLSSVTATAASAHISFAQVGAAVATMTAQGMTADRATQDLNHTIDSLRNPTSVMTNEMAQLGLNSQTVASQIGTRGLTGTVQELTQAITSHMGKSGEVLMSAFNKSASAAQDASKMLSLLPPSIRSVAKGYENGTVSYNTWYTATKGLGLQARSMADSFASVAGKAKGFNSLLTSGSPAAQTYTAALSKMTGGQTSLNTVLMLSGSHLSTFKKNAAGIAATGKSASSSVDNWSAIQSTFNFKMQSAKVAIENTGIAIGSAILPAVTSLITAILHVVEPIAEWTAKHKTLTEILFVGVTAIAATVTVVGLASKAFKAVKGAINDAQSAYRGLVKIFTKAGDEQAASAAKGATAQETSSAEAAAASETDAAETAAANETAAEETSGSWLTASLSMIANGAKWLAESTAKLAVVVAEQIAGAASTAAAWVIANATMLLGIGLIVVAVAAAVLLIVTHWKQISAALVAVWHDVVNGARTAWDTLVSVVTAVWDKILAFIKSWWPLLLGVVLGGVGLLAGLIIKYHAQIWDTIQKVWNEILSLIDSVVDRVESVARSAWDGITDLIRIANDVIWATIYKVWYEIEALIDREVTGIRNILGWFGRLGSLFAGWWDEAVSAVRTAWGRAETFIAGIPGRVVSALSSLYNDMLSVGKNLVRGIWNGLSSMGGWLMSQVTSFGDSVVSGIESAFGIHSPSKKTYVHGQMLGAGLAGGIIASIPQAVAAASQMASRVLAATAGLGASGHSIGASLAAGAAGAGGGGTTIILNVTGNTVMSDSDINKLVARIGKQLGTKILPQSGRKQRLS